MDERLTGDARTAWADAVRAPSARAEERRRAVVEGRGYLVTTGQQPGLFGGPLYSLYKAVTAARLADALEAALGVPVAPLFWTASEDHDWAEADHTALVGPDNELHELRLPSVEGSGSAPLHRLAMGAGVTDVVERCMQLLPNTEFSDRYLEVIRDAFTPAATLPDAFEALMARVLEPLGMLFVQAHDPVLKRLSRDLLVREARDAAAHERALSERAHALEAAGYAVQVPVLADGVNLFLEGPAGRERVYRDGDDVLRLRHSDLHLTVDELDARSRRAPDVLSPNVLLRPVVESAVFPTLSYVAGPGELAYFAQLQPLFEAFEVGMPVVTPRLGATVVEAKVGKVLKKFGLELGDLERPHDQVASELVRDEMPEPIRRALGELRGALGKGTQQLAQAVRELDPTLKGPIEHARSVAFDAIQDAERKILHAVRRESQTTLRQIEKAQLHLFPGGAPQERVMNPLYYLTRYGSSFVEAAASGFASALPVLGSSD